MLTRRDWPPLGEGSLEVDMSSLSVRSVLVEGTQCVGIYSSKQIHPIGNTLEVCFSTVFDHSQWSLKPPETQFLHALCELFCL